MNGDPSNKKNQFIYTLFYSVLVVLTAQINVHLFTRNFVASAGVIVFALLMLLLDEFAAMPVMFLSATGVMVTRSIAGAGKVLTSAEIWKTGMPEFVFYIVFGVVIYLLYNYVNSEGRSWTLFIVLFCGQPGGAVHSNRQRDGECLHDIRPAADCVCENGNYIGHLSGYLEIRNSNHADASKRCGGCGRKSL